MMKTKYFLHLILVVLLGFLSCDEFLDEDPKSYIAETNFYKTDAHAIGAINAAYAAMRQDAVQLPFLWMNEMTSDDVARGGTAVGEREELDLLVYNAAHGFLSAQWFSSYNCINRANIVLKYVNEGVSENIRNRVHAEARFLRAFQYFQLVRWFGGIPIHIEPTSSEPASLYPARATVQQVYDLIIEDLKYAEQHLDDRYEYTDSRNGGRATAGAAKSFLGKVYLTMAGQPLNQTDKWQLAEDKLAEVVANKNLYGYDLMQNLEDIFDVNKKASNKEAIWYLSGNSDLTPQGWYYTRLHHWFIRFNALFPTEETWKTLTPVYRINADGSQILDGEGNPILDMTRYSPYGVYEIEDQRRKAFIKRVQGTNLRDVDDRLEEGLAPRGQPRCAKYVDFEKVSDGRNDYPFTRFTDVKLMRAEALMEIGGAGNMNAALEIINQLRNRAGLAPATYSNQEELRQIIRLERRRELVFEGHRWTDLVRWGIFPETLRVHLSRERNIPIGDLSYITENHNLFPIPLNEIINNPNFGGQNPGY